MSPKLLIYLRTHRKSWGLTQRELAQLVGCGHPAQVSRYEHLVRQPSLETALSLQVIFAVAPDALFPGVHAEARRKVARRARALLEQLEEREPGADVQRKRELLANLLVREQGGV